MHAAYILSFLHMETWKAMLYIEHICFDSADSQDRAQLSFECFS